MIMLTNFIVLRSIDEWLGLRRGQFVKYHTILMKNGVEMVKM